MSSTARPCDNCFHYLRCKHELLACREFNAWVDAARTPRGASREPNRETYEDLALDSPLQRRKAANQRQARERLEALRREARRQTFEHKRRVAAGLAQPRTKAERRKLHLARRRRRWKIDPSLRKRHLLLKRLDAIRRGRRRGAAPKGSEGERRHRMEGQRRRRQAERERDGRAMNGEQFRHMRLQLGLSISEIANRFGTTYSAAKQWQRAAGPPSHVEAWLRAAQQRPLGQNAPPAGRLTTSQHSADRAMWQRNATP